MTRLTRRGFLVASGVGSGSVPTSTTVAGRRAAGAQAPAGNRWSDPASWSDGVPGPDRVAVVTKPIILDADVRVAGVVVEPDGQLHFDPQASHRLESAGNVVVRGRLVMQPASPDV